jgi:tetratricopeptide (TPR) repeat protein
MLTIAQLKAAYMSIKKMPEDLVTEAFKKVLEIAPDDASARINVIQSLWNKKDYDGVIAMCKPAREYNPDELAFYYFDGLAHYQKKDDDAALEDFRRGVSPN